MMAASDSTVRRAKAQRSTVPPLKPSHGVVTTLFNLIARLIAWYALYTVIFRCPSNPTDDDLSICHSSHTIKTAVQPRIQPYYDEFLSPYVNQYSPYVHHANKQYIIPAFKTANVTYHNYGEPYVVKGREYASQEYTRLLEPHVGSVKAKGQVYYKGYLEPHVKTANEIWVNMKPKVNHVQTQAEIYWVETILPAYSKVSPYVNTAYEQGKYVVVVVVAPVIKEVGEKAFGWGKGMWSEVVRPQVGRIGERLGSNNGNNSPIVEISSVASAAVNSESASESVISSMISSVSSKASASASKASGAAASKTQKLSKEEEKKIIDNDLLTWSSKFESSAEKALADLKAVIDEMADKAVGSKKTSAEKDIAQLEKLVNTGLESLKADIVSIVGSLSADSSEEEKLKAQDKLFAATRKVGTDIRDSAQAIRKDSEGYVAKLYDAVSESADQHLDVLDGIHNMGMQELGMKWAWMDHVTYKDWKKYHELKKGMKDARIRVIKSAETNAKLDQFTKWVEQDMEGRATEIAKNAAEELLRIKKLGKKKIQLVDSSNDFSNDYVPIAAKKAAQKAVESAEKVKDAFAAEPEIKEGGIGQKVLSMADEAQSKVEEAVVDSSTPLAESVASVAKEASEKLYGTTQNVAEKATESASSIYSAVKSRIPGGVNAGFVANAEEIIYEDDHIIDDVSSRLAEASKAVSEAVSSAIAYGSPTEPPIHESLKSQYDELTASAVSAASSVLYGTPAPAAEQIFTIATDKYSGAVAAASSILYGRPTPTHQLLLSKASEAHASATNAAEDKYHSAKRLAVTKVNNEDKPVRESMYSVAKDQYDAAVSAADASYTSFVEAASLAKMSLSEAVASAEVVWNSAREAASTKIYGTPQPASESAISVAAEKYSSVKAEAQKVYEAWYTPASSAIYGTQTAAWESATSAVVNGAAVGAASAASIASDASSVYASAADAANSAASDAASTASSYLFGTPAPTDVSAELQQRYEDLQNLFAELLYSKEPSYASSAKDRFNAAVYGTPTPAWEAAKSTLNEQYLSASAAAEAAVAAILKDSRSRIEELYTEAHEAVYGPEPSKAELVMAEIRAARQSAIDAVSIRVYGTPKGTFEAATDSVASLVAEATNSATSLASDASSVLSDATGVVKDYMPANSDMPWERRGLFFWARKEIVTQSDHAEIRLRLALEKVRNAAKSVGNEVKESFESAASVVGESAKKEVKDEL